MVKKKRSKKAVKKKSSNKTAVRSTKKKIQLVLKNLILFGVLTGIFFFLYKVSNNEIFRTLHQLLAMVLGFVALAFLIVFLALVIMKGMNK